MESVTTTSLIGEFSRRAIAGPDNTGWVQEAQTYSAPWSISA